MLSTQSRSSFMNGKSFNISNPSPSSSALPPKNPASHGHLGPINSGGSRLTGTGSYEVHPSDLVSERSGKTEKSAKSAALLSSKWNTKVQTPHGGQDWRDLPNFVEDFSVTTNLLGPPEKAMEAARQAMLTIEHYPASDNEPSLSDLSSFLGLDSEEKNMLIMGNGASELIDLSIRMAPKKDEVNFWKPGPFITQYKEYERSATNSGYLLAPPSSVRNAWLSCIVNPCNPTGDFLELYELKKHILDTCREGSWVLVDESMQPWLGEQWRENSLVGAREWVKDLYQTKKIGVFVIHSWTKLWACPGMRLGSILCPDLDIATALKKMQVPWSVNSMAQAFLSACCADRQYLEDTWRINTECRAITVDELQRIAPHWKIRGPSWCSWLWIDTGDHHEAKSCVSKCKAGGVPIRWGKFGYDLPTYIRIGVRSPESIKVLVGILEDFLKTQLN